MDCATKLIPIKSMVLPVILIAVKFGSIKAAPIAAPTYGLAPNFLAAVNANKIGKKYINEFPAADNIP